ncbi:DNA polymerase III subunit delta [Liquorilactobacillus sicerae]|uniref:DNA polymerase III subunit delta n=1 Tax=Liquorilactobacillus sicerae TaxID=1416943 RepID=UPI00248160D7|nr:DNA polymerase III subunit delta [Liquorilactobacillus sicerae]
MQATEFLTKKSTEIQQPIYLITGTEKYLKNQVITKLSSLIPSGLQSMNLGKFDMEDEWLADAINDAYSVPFMGEQRVVIILHPYFLTADKIGKKLNQDPTELEKYLANPATSTILVIVMDDQKIDARKKVCKLLKKEAFQIDCLALNEKEVSQIASKKIKQNGYRIEESALGLLLQKTEANFSETLAEIKKLFLTAEKTKVITQEMVARLVPQTLEQNVFDLNKYVLNNQKTAALRIYHDLLLQREEPLKLNALLIGQVRLLLQTLILLKHGYSQGDIAETLRVHPYRVKLAIQNSRVFTQEKLRTAYLSLLKLEEKIKTTSQSPENLFQLFLTGYFDE